MQQFKLIKKIPLLILSTLVGSAYADPIGSVIEATGNSGLTRSSEEIVVSPSYLPEVELNDLAETENSRMLIEFLDKAELALTENTRVLIDTVIYDPNPSKSKMAMKMVFGTARFASGVTGQVPKQNIDIQTPTAQITVRGTNFTTTIDEIGRSLVILLPDEFGLPSGVIEVSNDAGSVTLTEAYAATMVSSLDSAPTSSVVIQGITPAVIDNMFIVNPPAEIKEKIQEDLNENQDSGILDVDFLEFNELETDYFAETEQELEFSELDIDFLDVDFLTDLLDIIEELDKVVAGSQPVEAGSGEVDLRGATIGKNANSQYNIFIEDDGIVFYRSVNGVIKLRVPVGSSTRIETIVEGYEGIIQLNGGDDSLIIIKQS